MRTTDRILDLDLATPRPTLAARLSTWLANVRSLRSALRNHRAANRLIELDDRLLNDLGLSRVDIHEVLNLVSYADDPSPHLKRVARRRSENSLRGVRAE
ncbi:DUF1127 domain-containing protein [Rhizobium sp. 18065]|uniref:DUF1127 domain-containing protein n=1 Tax=Rhizobium sp. 18065 TaxID=2681411 RepID=UPI0013597105|nr:DUF1127 domain-containing protein [Rhizobium sp. 18065]